MLTSSQPKPQMMLLVPHPMVKAVKLHLVQQLQRIGIFW